MKKIHGLALVTPLVLALVNPAFAQEAKKSNGTEEIIVTARKRSENIQKVAATMEVVDASKLASAGVTSLKDIGLVTPGVNITKSPTANAYSVTVRGLGSSTGNPSFDSSVSLFVDGIYTPRARDFSSAIFDIGRIETIKGTQTALLGKNTSMGAVNLTVRKPGKTLSADLRSEYEFEEKSNHIEGGIDLPVSDQFRFRVSGMHDDTKGPIKNVVDGSNGPNNKSDAYRIVGIFEPSDTFKITAMGQNYNGTMSGANAEWIAINTPAAAFLSAISGHPGVLEPNLDYKTSVYSSALGGATSGKLNAQRGSLNFDWQLAGGYTLTAQSGYIASKQIVQDNVSYLPTNFFLQDYNSKGKQFTQEVRIASPTTDKFNYILGALYLDGTFEHNETVVSTMPQLDPSFPAVSGTQKSLFSLDDKAYSAFFSANYDVSEIVQANIGLRYTKEKKTADMSRQSLVPGVYSLFVMPPFAPFTRSKTEGSFDGSLGVNVKLSRDVMLYASWGQGTKAGGYANSVSNLMASRYEPEVAKTTEVGMKSRWFDRTVTLNIAGFDTRVDGFQMVTFTGTAFNVGNTQLKSYGVESLIDWAFMPGAKLFWNNTYAISRDADNGSRIPFAPMWSGAAGVNYSTKIASNLVASADLNVEYKSDQTSQQNPSAAPWAQGFKHLNASVAVGAENKSWELRLIGKNLTDEHTFGFDFPAPLLPPGNFVAIPLSPRTVSLQLSLKY